MHPMIHDLVAEIERLERLLDVAESLAAARLRTIRHQRAVIDDLRAAQCDGPAMNEASMTAEAAWLRATSEGGDQWYDR